MSWSCFCQILLIEPYLKLSSCVSHLDYYNLLPQCTFFLFLILPLLCVALNTAIKVTFLNCKLSTLLLICLQPFHNPQHRKRRAGFLVYSRAFLLCALAYFATHFSPFPPFTSPKTLFAPLKIFEKHMLKYL